MVLLKYIENKLFTYFFLLKSTHPQLTYVATCYLFVYLTLF